MLTTYETLLANEALGFMSHIAMTLTLARNQHPNTLSTDTEWWRTQNEKILKAAGIDLTTGPTQRKDVLRIYREMARYLATELDLLLEA